MFLDELASGAVEIVIIDRMNVATIAHADAICGAQIAVVNVWDCFRNGAKRVHNNANRQ